MSAAYLFSSTADVLGGKVLCRSADCDIYHLGYDSRILNEPANTLFFAITGKGHDGHDYLYECFLKGVRCFVIERENALAGFSEEARREINVLLVKNSMAAMQKLAAWHRSRFHIPVLGITGSNGKTVVKEWLFQLLQNQQPVTSNQPLNVLRSPKSFNSQLGVPLSVWQLDEAYNLAIFEAGISEPGEMQKLAGMIRPTWGIFTNIGEAHQAHFDSLQQKADEKLTLFYDAELLIYCADYPEIGLAVEKAKKAGHLTKTEIVSWTLKNGGISVSTQKADGRTELIIPWPALSQGSSQSPIPHLQSLISIPFTDAASIENLTHCSLFMLRLGIPEKEINERIQKLHPIEMRLELKQAINGCTLINDSYNSDLHSLSIALDTLNQQQQHPKKTVILSDILESGRDEKSLYSEVAKLLKQKKIDRFIGIGPALCRHIGLFKQENYFYADTNSFLKEHDFRQFRDEAILLKGSRPFGFEAIARRLAQKTHQTVLEINLSAIAHNLKVYRSLLRPQTRIMAMVKAFSYGSGSYEIANILQFQKVDYLAVAYADEGVYLRQNGISLPVMVMNPEDDALETMIEHKLEPEIYSFRVLRHFTEALAGRSSFPVHLKIDTGMHRLGFEIADLPALVRELQAAPQLKIQSVFSHLASADVFGHDDFSRRQIDEFIEVCENIAEVTGQSFLRHILNSSGVVRFPEAQLDMVRLGIGLYGIDPVSSIQKQLEPVSTLKTHISQIRQLGKGESIGYSRAAVLSAESTIATVGIGYADGIPRALGNGVGKAMVNGSLAPVIGNVCMDMCMLDITGIAAQEGDEVILFGKDLPVEKLAESAHTIAYEILTSVSQRVKRVYFKE